jgi:tRNA-specific 2-thiouridylase
MKTTKKKIVAVAMSGGVDSSVAAYLLKQQGYEVIGVMAKFWGDAAFREGGFQDTCCSIETRKKGELVAEKLGIPFYFLDFEVPFKEHVVDVFVDGYKNGTTPNPCVLCNREVKIGLLLKKAQEMFGVEYLATGHYAKVSGKGKNLKIQRAKDTQKDQTYFISRVRKADLEYLIFPCGNYTKPEIRGIAKKAGLAPLVLAESQELCFFSEKTPGAYLQKNLGKIQGAVVDHLGKKLGTHEGAYKFTLGQRKGLDLKMEKAVYVSEIDTQTMTLH